MLISFVVALILDESCDSNDVKSVIKEQCDGAQCKEISNTRNEIADILKAAKWIHPGLYHDVPGLQFDGQDTLISSSCRVMKTIERCILEGKNECNLFCRTLERHVVKNLPSVDIPGNVSVSSFVMIIVDGTWQLPDVIYFRSSENKSVKGRLISNESKLKMNPSNLFGKTNILKNSG